MKYCLPIIKDNFQDIDNLLKQECCNYDYIEIWLDYLPFLDSAWCTEICTKFPNKILYVLRRLNFDECKYKFEERKKILETLVGLPCLLDLDISQHAEELRFLQKLGDKAFQQLVLSYHDYKNTPGQNVLLEIYKEMQKYKPYIYKFSTFCDSYSDSMRLAQFLIDLRKQKANVIVLGMGEYGKITRILGQLFGNFMLFVCANDSSSSAPGQLSKLQVENILKELER